MITIIYPAYTVDSPLTPAEVTFLGHAFAGRGLSVSLRGATFPAPGAEGLCHTTPSPPNPPVHVPHFSPPS